MIFSFVNWVTALLIALAVCAPIPDSSGSQPSLKKKVLINMPIKNSITQMFYAVTYALLDLETSKPHMITNMVTYKLRISEDEWTEEKKQAVFDLAFNSTKKSRATNEYWMRADFQMKYNSYLTLSLEGKAQVNALAKVVQQCRKSIATWVKQDKVALNLNLIVQCGVKVFGSEYVKSDLPASIVKLVKSPKTATTSSKVAPAASKVATKAQQ